MNVQSGCRGDGSPEGQNVAVFINVRDFGDMLIKPALKTRPVGFNLNPAVK